MKAKYLLAGLALVQAASSVAAPLSPVEKRYSPDYNRCMASGDAANGVTTGIMDCTGQEIDRQDARLNQAYKMVMVRLDPAQKVALRTSTYIVCCYCGCLVCQRGCWSG